MDAYEILVLILSIVLAIMLVGMTICTFIFVKILKDIRNITTKASEAADNIEQAAVLFKNTSGMAAIFKVVGNAVETFRASKSKREDG